jgi:hypothetical protein
MEKVCKNCCFFVLTGTRFDTKSKLTSKCGVCQKLGTDVKKVAGRLVGGDPVWNCETCSDFEPKQKPE